ncbi:MAG: motility protein A [Deltaproteobacteria bacterium]|nr:motility protein A [Deltaproteobacteria bacterium]
MDKATIIGLVLANVLIVLGMVITGDMLWFIPRPGAGDPVGFNFNAIWSFVDGASVLIVVGGSIGTMLMAYPMSTMLTAVKAGKNIFKEEKYDPEATVKLLSELSGRARREGLLSLEDAANETQDDFLKRGLLLMADGHEASTIESVLFDEMAKIEERHKVSIGVWEFLATIAPAMGMIGTLVGLVLMLQQMDDPNAIGPAMAVALLTTFYGSFLANVIGIPIASKLKARSAEELANKALITSGMLSILAGENPRFMVERLNAILPPSQRVDGEVAA